MRAPTGSRSTNYSDDRLIGICRRELQRAEGYIADEIQANRESAIQYYLGKPRGDDVDGLSKVQSLDVADMIEACLSFMVPALAGESIVQFAAVGREDEDQAAKESRMVQAMLKQGGSNSFVAIQEAVKDALLLRIGILKVWIDETSETERQSYPGIPGTKEEADPAIMAELLGEPEYNVERKVDRMERNARGAAGAGWSWSVVIKTTVTTRRLKIAAVDPTEFFWSPELASLDLNDARFFAERQLLTRSELIDEGFKESQVKSLPTLTVETRSDKWARSRSTNSELAAEDFWQEQIEVHRCYAMLGTGEGGRSERWCLTLAGETHLLGKYKVKCQPYAVGAVLYSGHMLEGISLFDKLRQVQDTKTGFLRAWLNNAQLVNRPRAVYMEGVVNEDDLFNVEIGGGIRAQRADAVSWLQQPDIGPSCASALEYQDKMRAERGGASLEMLAPGLQLNSPTAAGTERELQVKEQLAALMCRNLAETMLRGAYLIAHKVLRYEMKGPVQVKSGGAWEEDEPQNWPAREDLGIVVGMSPGERSRRLIALTQVIQQQEKLLLNGQEGVLVDLKQYHTALNEWARAAGLDAPEKYILDPMSEGAQQRQQQNAQMQKQQSAAQADLARQLEVIKAQAKAFETLIDVQFKYWQENLKADVAEMQVTGKASADLEMSKLMGSLRSQGAGESAGATAEAAAAVVATPPPEAGQLPAGSINQ